MKATLCILGILSIFFAQAFSQSLTSKDAAYYTSEPAKWDGKSVTIMVNDCSSNVSNSQDGKLACVTVYTANGVIDVWMPADKAKAFIKRYDNPNYTDQRRTLTGAFRASDKSIVLVTK